jgi:hypothetical protein
MPSCFQLLDKTTKEPVGLNTVDELICTEVLNVPVHPKFYGGGKFNWFDSIGFTIATNSDKQLGSQELRDHYLKSEMWADEAPVFEKVLDFLESKYTSRNFYSHN